MDTFCIQVVNKVFTTVINTKFPYYDYEKDLLICDEEDYILDILHLRISRILVDGDPYGYRELIKNISNRKLDIFQHMKRIPVVLILLLLVIIIWKVIF